MKTPTPQEIRQHPAYHSITDIADLINDISEARKGLAELEAEARTTIPQLLTAYFTAAGDAATKRIDLGDGSELTIEDEWWDHRNPLSSVRLSHRPQSLEAITLDAIAIANDQSKAQQTEPAT